MIIPKVKVIHARRPPKAELPSPLKPDISREDTGEVLSGTVMDKKASAPEERLYRALSKSKSIDALEFRYTMGAPRNLPGWFECDFVISSHGTLYPIEVDSEFSHRMKKRSDVLHDAKVLQSLSREGNVWPQVIHLDMETDLVDQKSADRTAKRIFG